MSRGSEPFADAVANKAGVSADDAVAVLDKHGVTAAPRPPAARSLSIRHIAFGGEKRWEDGRADPFSFKWDVAEPGLWLLASEGNLVGKSTILQVALWALRGKPKRLTRTVRGWIQKVEVSFQADGARIDVAFQMEGGEPVGSVRSTSGASLTEQVFQSEEQFKRAMQDVMLETLALEPIPASRTGSDGRVATHDDGWLAYTGAFLSDSQSDAIIGEHIGGTDLTQRLLQVYLGLPWATTMFQARVRAKQLKSEVEQRRRRMPALGGKSLEEVEAELAAVRRQIGDETARSRAAQELTEAQVEYDRLAEEVRAARRGADEASFAAEEAKAAELRAERVVLTLREDRAASLFLRRLSPVCCPRCERPIHDERRHRELNERRCSICTEEMPQGDVSEADAYLAQAEERLEEARRLAADAGRAARQMQAGFGRMRQELTAAGSRLQAAASAGTAADVQVMIRRAERLEGMLDVARAFAQAEGADEVAARVLEAAEREAAERATAAADAVLGPVSDEICRVATRFGVRDVSRVVLKRNAHVELHQGGSVVNWGEITAGEQLRLRVATVAALVRSARSQGTGRHPGLLLIDSPGSEEMHPANVADMLEELANLTREIDNLQIFVAMQGPEKARTAVGPRRLLECAAGNFMW